MSHKPLEIDLITLFPEMVEGYFGASMLARAQKHGLISIKVHDLRKWAPPPHHVVDDRPFGGGPGMLLKPEPIAAAIKQLRREGTKTVYLSPDGEGLSPQIGESLAKEEHIIMLSGHYEGVDERIREHYIDQEISIGNYILTNGTLPAAVVIDVMARFVPGVLGEEKSLTCESFSDNLLSFPQYTRPAEFEGHSVPEVLMGGNHKAIEKWRHEQRIIRTENRISKKSDNNASNN